MAVTAKDQMLEILDKLPDDSSYEELLRELAKIGRGAGEADRGDVDDPDETQPFPPSVLDARWDGGPPVEAIRAALAEEPENREAVTEVLSQVAGTGGEDTKEN